MSQRRGKGKNKSNNEKYSFIEKEKKNYIVYN